MTIRNRDPSLRVAGLLSASNGAALALLGILSVLLHDVPARAAVFDAPTPAAFLPGGLLGVQLGTSWQRSKLSPWLEHVQCQRDDDDANDFDEICFFKTSTASRVGGARVYDGFMAGKDDRLVLIGTGITIKNADDPLAESVMRSFQLQVHAAFQHNGDDVLFVDMPQKPMSPLELRGYSQKAPALLVQLEPKRNELAVLYGYLAPVNVFSTVSSD